MRIHARRLVTLLTVLMFSFSMFGHAFIATQAVAQAASSSMAMDMGSMDEPMGCGGDLAAHAACVAICASGIAILCSPVMVPVIGVVEDLPGDAEVTSWGWGIPPEPHPPKQAVQV